MEIYAWIDHVIDILTELAEDPDRPLLEVIPPAPSSRNELAWKPSS